MIFKRRTADSWWQQATRIASVRDRLNKHDIKYKMLDDAWWLILDKYIQALTKEAK